MSSPAVVRGFEPCDRASWRDPFSMYRALRDHDPVHHVVPEHAPDDDYWVLSRFEHIFDAVRDAATFSSAQGLTFTYGEREKLDMDFSPMVMMDPPEHTDFRRLVGRGFTPRRVADIEADVRAFVVDRIERLRGAGEGDLIEALAKPLPSFVVAHYLGVPAEDRDRFDRWTDAIVAAGAEGDVLRAHDAVGELVVYFSDLIERRRAEPADDMTSALVHAERHGEPVPIMDILGFAFTMVSGGNDTTTGMLGGSAELLTSRPDQRQVLLDDPSVLPGAVDELLRLTSPVQGLARTTTREVDIEGTTIPAGRKVLLLYGSGNRDEREFGDDAAALDVRRDIDKILTFGYGAHHCLGAAAARLQARVALEELLTRCPRFAVDPEAGRFAPGHFVRRYESLPFVADAG